MPKGKMKMSWSKAPSNLDVEGVKKLADREDSISKRTKKTDELLEKSSKMITKKYAKGSKGIDATDASYEKPTPNKPELVKLNDVPVRTNTDTFSKTEAKTIKTAVTQDQKNVAAYQRRRGLEADGAWGDTSGPNKSNTQKVFEKEQAAKRTMVTKPKSVVSTANNTSSTSSPIGSSTDMSKVKADKYVKAKVSEAQPISKPKMNTSPAPKTGVDGDAEHQRRVRSIEMQYGGGEDGAAGWVDKKSADELARIEQEGNEKGMGLASKIGLGATAVGVIGAAVGVRRAMKGKNPIGKTLGTHTEEIINGVRSKPNLVSRMMQKSASKIKMVAPEAPEIKAKRVATEKANKAMSATERDNNPEFKSRQEVIDKFAKNGKASEKAAKARGNEVKKSAKAQAEKVSAVKSKATVPSKADIDAQVAAASQPKVMNTKKTVDRGDAAMTAANKYTQPRRDHLKAINTETSNTTEALAPKKRRGRQKATKNMPVVETPSENRGLLLEPAMKDRHTVNTKRNNASTKNTTKAEPRKMRTGRIKDVPTESKNRGLLLGPKKEKQEFVFDTEGKYLGKNKKK